MPHYREIPYQDPFELYCRIRSSTSMLLESLKGPDNISRYSFIGIEPFLIFTAKNGSVNISQMDRKIMPSAKPLRQLRELVCSYAQDAVPGLPPFQGGAAGMLSYDFVRYFEKLPETATDDLCIPDAHFLMFDRVISFDHKEKRSWLIVCPGARAAVSAGPADLKSDEEHRKDAEHEIERLTGLIHKNKEDSVEMKYQSRNIDILRQTTKERYMAMVARTKEYISAGDIFQANLSLRLAAEIGETDPLHIYGILRRINPSPFAAYIDFGDYQIVSSSPERLVRVSGRFIDTRPIAGTRPRGRDLSEDESMRAELLLNEKERAEHIMLIDLERNDLGKVSDYGSVLADELMITEKYSHVIHIVSNVRGTLAQGMDCFDVIRAAFPGGTITGVPKVRCMEIIEELEGRRRGPYTGSLGYIGFNGDMDLNIIIRTFLIKGGTAYVQAGAGIVADSDPEREYYESLKKAEALINTLNCLCK